MRFLPHSPISKSIQELKKLYLHLAKISSYPSFWIIRINWLEILKLENIRPTPPCVEDPNYVVAMLSQILFVWRRWKQEHVMKLLCLNTCEPLGGLARVCRCCSKLFTNNIFILQKYSSIFIFLLKKNNLSHK